MWWFRLSCWLALFLFIINLCQVNCSDPPSKCERHQVRMERKIRTQPKETAITLFKPSCLEDGNYNTTQCHCKWPGHGKKSQLHLFWVDQLWGGFGRLIRKCFLVTSHWVINCKGNAQTLCHKSPICSGKVSNQFLIRTRPDTRHKMRSRSYW